MRCSAALVLAAPGALLAPAVLMLGLTAPAITVVTRWLWARDVGERRQPRVFGLDTALQDGAFVVGPLLAGVVAETAGPSAALAVLVALGCAGGAGLVLVVPAVARSAARPCARTAAIRSSACSSPSAGLGVIYGALGVGAVAVALDAGRDGAAGVVTAALFAGGIVGDLVLAPRRPDVPVARRLRARVPVLLVATALVPLAPGVVGVTVAVALTGAVLANASVTLLLDLAARASAHVRAEGFGWSGATLRLGNAAGAGAAGVLAEQVDARAALAVALAGAALATAVVLRPSSSAGVIERVDREARDSAEQRVVAGGGLGALGGADADRHGVAAPVALDHADVVAQPGQRAALGRRPPARLEEAGGDPRA